MNKGRKIKQLRRYILSKGRITSERKVAPTKSMKDFRKGAYSMRFENSLMSISTYGSNKYEVYKKVYHILHLNMTESHKDAVKILREN